MGDAQLGELEMTSVMSKSPKRARPRVIKEVNCVENSFMPVPSWMKSMLENAKSDTAKTNEKKIISGSAFLSTEGVKPILGTRADEIFMILSSCTQTHRQAHKHTRTYKPILILHIITIHVYT